MSYERQDNRTLDQLRNTKITPNISPYAEGSALIEVGGTKVICTASVEDRVPMFMRNKGLGWVTAEYAMLPRATNTRTQRETQRGPSGRTQEIQRLIGRSLRAVVDTKLLGERQIYLDCDVIQADGGTRCFDHRCLRRSRSRVSKIGKTGNDQNLAYLKRSRRRQRRHYRRHADPRPRLHRRFDRRRRYEHRLHRRRKIYRDPRHRRTRTLYPRTNGRNARPRRDRRQKLFEIQRNALRVKDFQPEKFFGRKHRNFGITFWKNGIVADIVGNDKAFVNKRTSGN